MNRQDRINRTVRIAALIWALGFLVIWATCGCARVDAQVPLPEAPTDATAVLSDLGLPADSGQVASGLGLGGVTGQEVQARASTPPESAEGLETRGGPVPEAGSPSPQSRNPFDENWLDVGYQLDSREDKRIVSFEGHSRVSEYVDVAGQLDLESSLDQDLARFRLRGDVYGRINDQAGVVLHYEDFTGSWNEAIRLGFYRDVGLGGEQPFCRLVGLAGATDGVGPMLRSQFEVALHERWVLAGFLEVAWDDAEDWTAAEPELRYLITDGLWATAEYRRDERQDEIEGVAIGLRGRL